MKRWLAVVLLPFAVVLLARPLAWCAGVAWSPDLGSCVLWASLVFAGMAALVVWVSGDRWS